MKPEQAFQTEYKSVTGASTVDTLVDVSTADIHPESVQRVGSFTHLQTISTVIGCRMTKPEFAKKERTGHSTDQPMPFTPGVTKTMVREHAFKLYRDKLARHRHLSLEDWVLAEKDMVSTRETEGLLTR